MASILPLTGALGVVNARHLLRRATFKITNNLVAQYALLTPQQALTALLDFASNTPAQALPVRNTDGQPYFPDAANPTVTYDSTYSNSNTVSAYFLNNAVRTPTLEWKLTWFLHSIFTSDYNSSFVWYYDYLSLLRTYCAGSYKELAYKITLNPRMLLYLDNRYNSNTAPNENYAREFLELFTILKGPQIAAGNYTNYTELDVVQAAKVLTGFRLNTNVALRPNYSDLGATANTGGYAPNPSVANAGWAYTATNIPTGYAVASAHATGNKTFSPAFGNTVITGSNATTGTYTIYDELQSFINMVFNQNATAENLARRLYRFFVNRKVTPEIETDIIAPLVTQLKSVQGGVTYNLGAAVRLLLESQHFYDEDDTTPGDEILGDLVRSPLELHLHTLSMGEVALPHPVNQYATAYGFWVAQISAMSTENLPLFNPFSVNGYAPFKEAPDYDKLWLTISSLKQRYGSWVDSLLNGVTYSGTKIRLDAAEFVRTNAQFSAPGNSTQLVADFYNLLFITPPSGSRDLYFSNKLLGGLTATNWLNTWNAWAANPTSTSLKLSVTTAINRLVKAMIQSREFQVL